MDPLTQAVPSVTGRVPQAPPLQIGTRQVGARQSLQPTPFSPQAALLVPLWQPAALQHPLHWLPGPTRQLQSPPTQFRPPAHSGPKEPQWHWPPSQRSATPGGQGVLQPLQWK